MSEPPGSLDISDLKETFLECPVCLLHFDQRDKRPRLLHPCLHAFCTDCLHKLLAKEGGGQITCPLCRIVQKIRGNVQSLPVDPVRNKLVDYVKLKNEKQILCTECDENNVAISRCQDCQAYLCKNCDHVHRRYRLTKGHTVLPMEKILEDPIKNLSLRHMCPLHPDHKLEFYCTTDEKLCCVSCTVLDHKGHDLVGLDKAASERKEEVETLLKVVLKKANDMREAKQELLKQEKKIQDTKAKSIVDIDSMFDAIKKTLDERKRVLVVALDDRANQLMSTVQKTSGALDQTLAVIESTETYYTEAKGKADVVELLKLYPVIRRSLEGVEGPQRLTGMGGAVAAIKFLKKGHTEAELVIKKTGDFDNDAAGAEQVQGRGNFQGQFSFGCLRVHVYKADMTKLQLDAIVNATNGMLSHGSGLAKAIAVAAGQEFEDEGRRYVRDNGQIPVAGVASTSAGHLPCKVVLHAVGPMWSDYTGPKQRQRCFHDLCMTVLRCLIEADKIGARDVAIPPISSGIFRVPHEVCSEAYWRGTRLYGEICSPRTLKRAHFVDTNDGMLAMIHDTFTRCKGQPLDATEEEIKFLMRFLP